LVKKKLDHDLFEIDPALEGGFFLIDNILDVRVALPYELGPGQRLQRATNDQIVAIKTMLKESGLDGAVGKRSSWYENSFETNALRQRIPTKLPPEDWRYFIIAFDTRSVPNSQSLDVLRALYLEQPAVYSSCLAYTTGVYGEGQANARAFQTTTSEERRFSVPELEVVDETVASNWRIANSTFASLDFDRYEGIYNATELFRRLHDSIMPSGFRVLGLFMVIEMLLTHAPGDKEIGDSLAHQISTKIPLLAERMSLPLDYVVFSKDVRADQIWKRLYQYRSLIAHGSHAEFSSGPLALLKDQRTADRFLTTATRRLLRLAINEPALVTALKSV
jgi:hypothetical protein